MSNAPRTTVVFETGNGKFQNKVEIGAHTFFASEPAELGGDDSGPTPIEIMNAALGTCTSITLRMYAERKGWPLQSIYVEISHQRGKAEECAIEGREVPSHPQEIFTKKIKLEGPLDPKQIERLLMIADKCPVHRILTQQACLRTQLIS